MAKGSGLTTRNLFNSDHGVGKGDKTRVSNPKAFHENISRVKFGGVTGLRPMKKLGHSRKVYPS